MKTAAPKTFAELRERYTPHAAVVFVLLALLVLGRMFFGGSSTPNRSATRNRNRSAITSSRTPPAIPTSTNAASQGAANQGAESEPSVPLVPIDSTWTIPELPEARRNIFAYFVAVPKSPATASPLPILTPLPVVTPVPPTLTATNVSPGSVFARTGEFTLQVSGDKFTPDVRIYVDARELPTVFTSPQQLSAKVPADMIASPGAHQVVVRTADNQLFSNPLALNVNAPPTPSYDYIGIIGEKRKDTAVLKEKTGGKLHNVQRNDLVGGRFKVTAITDTSIEFTDVELNIKHTVQFSKASASPSSATIPAFSG